jgi:nitrogen fixation NifU-like protein
MLRTEDIYEEILSDQMFSSIHNRNCIDNINQSAEDYNHACGDRIQVSIHNEQNVIQEISFTGDCCPSSKLSAVLMTEELAGKTTEEAEILFKKVLAIITSGDEYNHYRYDGMLPILIKQLSVISAGRKGRQSTKCILLPWKVMFNALHSKKVRQVATEKDYSLYLY